jgi:hypothetical protein
MTHGAVLYRDVFDVPGSMYILGDPRILLLANTGYLVDGPF